MAYVCLEEDTYPVDIEEEIVVAQKAMLDAGVGELPVWVGDPECPDSYRNGETLFV